MGADIIDTEDGFIINSRSNNTIPTLTAQTLIVLWITVSQMMSAVAGLNADGETIITDSDCADVSYPGFFTIRTAFFYKNQSVERF